MNKKLSFVILLFSYFTNAQTYTSFFTGDTGNVVKTTEYRLCLMGGSTEDDNAMRWFLNGSGGGDIVVIRSSGSNGYNSYLYTNLGILVNSVETIVIPSVIAANDPYVKRRLREAEAVFISGGNQFDYLTFWKNTEVDSAINYLINVKKIPIGGTSAGMAIQGQAYYSAAAGSITSPIALANPFSAQVTIGNNDFLHNPLLNRVITDTHFDNPDRRGRQSTFLARLFQDSAKVFYGISCDEHTAVCIDSFGNAKVYGGFPTYDDNAYFIQPNCILPNNPETCLASQSLTWNRAGQALKVYEIKGTAAGAGSFNVKNWQNPSATGGNWQNWFINNGTFSSTINASSILCTTTNLHDNFIDEVKLYPNPTKNILNFNNVIDEVILRNIYGQILIHDFNSEKIETLNLKPGIYIIELRKVNLHKIIKIIKE